MHLNYVAIRVTDLDRSVKFYTDVLGLEEVKRTDSRKFGLGIWVLLEDGKSGQHIELDWYPPGSEYAVPYTPGEALDHVGFIVDDVEATYRDLLAKGANPTGVDRNATEGWTAFLKDPDGNWIEIYQLTEPKRPSTR